MVWVEGGGTKVAGGVAAAQPSPAAHISDCSAPSSSEQRERRACGRAAMVRCGLLLLIGMVAVLPCSTSVPLAERPGGSGSRQGRGLPVWGRWEAVRDRGHGHGRGGTWTWDREEAEQMTNFSRVSYCRYVLCI